MKKTSFFEYLDSKKKIGKPVVDPTGDQIDPKTSPVKPPKAKNRYKPGVTQPKTPGKGAWGDLGEKGLIYKPDLKNANGCKPAKIPTAEQVRISNAFIADFASDPTLIETFVRQLRATGMFGAVVAEVFDQRETAATLAEILATESHGPKLHKTLTAALNEEVAKPFGDQLGDDGDADEDEDNDPFADEDGDEGDLDNPDEEDLDGEGDDLDVSKEDGEGDPNQDPSMGGDMAGMDPAMMGMDPNMMDPSMMGMDPSMGGMPQPGMDPNMMDPSMMGGMPQPGMPPMMPQQPANPMMGMMKAYQRAMMRANMGKR